jgi:hypothetical protein
VSGDRVGSIAAFLHDSIAPSEITPHLGTVYIGVWNIGPNEEIRWTTRNVHVNVAHADEKEIPACR